MQPGHWSLFRVHVDGGFGCAHLPQLAADLVPPSRGCRGGGARGQWLLQRILQTATQCLFFLFFFSRNSSYSSPWSKQAPGLSHSPAWLSPKNLAVDPAPWPGASVTLVPALVPGTLLSLSTLLAVWFFNVLYDFWSPIFIYAGVLLALFSVPQKITSAQGEVDSSPTYHTTIFLYLKFFELF